MGAPTRGKTQPGGANAPKFYYKHKLGWFDKDNKGLMGSSLEDIQSKSAAHETKKAAEAKAAAKAKKAAERQKAKKAAAGPAKPGVKEAQKTSNRQLKPASVGGPAKPAGKTSAPARTSKPVESPVVNKTSIPIAGKGPDVTSAHARSQAVAAKLAEMRAKKAE